LLARIPFDSAERARHKPLLTIWGDAALARNIDETDRRIIRELEINARKTNQEIAEKIGIAASTLTRRLQWLEENKIIKRYTCEVEPNYLGYTTLGYTLVTLSTTAKMPLNEVIRRFTEIPEVAEVCKIFGADDLIVKIYAEDTRHYQRILEKIRATNVEDGYHTTSMLVSEVVYDGGVADVIKKAQQDPA
jgi:DNA-binding Lrp family transcriptional regulator